MIEKNFDIPFIADLALREKQIQQNYRPIIAVHKWFARRPGTLFRGLLLSEFGHPASRGLLPSERLEGPPGRRSLHGWRDAAPRGQPPGLRRHSASTSTPCLTGS